MIDFPLKCKKKRRQKAKLAKTIILISAREQPQVQQTFTQLSLHPPSTHKHSQLQHILKYNQITYKLEHKKHHFFFFS